MKRILPLILAATLSFWYLDASAARKNTPQRYPEAAHALDSMVRAHFPDVTIGQEIKITRVQKSKIGSRYDFHLSRTMLEYPLQKGDAAWVQNTLQGLLPRNVKIRNIYVEGLSLNILECNPLTNSGNSLPARWAKSEWERVRPLVYSAADSYITNGLNGRHIALWGSHGYYYDPAHDRWQWQRPTLFGTIEDLLSQSIACDYLAPMIENAGGVALMPRERGVQDSLLVICNLEGTSKFSFTPPSPGDYPIYISYPEGEGVMSLSIAGRSLTIDREKGFGMPVYLGEYHLDGSQVEVLLSPKGAISSMRIGSGIGRSGLPRYCEAARYYLEDTGADSTVFASTLFYKPKYPGDKIDIDDYTDDIRARGLWCMDLIGGSRALPDEPGRKIPVDLSLALHSDAGISADSTFIGTLAIYTSKCDNATNLPDGSSRNVSRELAYLIQSQIVSDLRSFYDSAFVRRGIWDRSYSESRTTGVSAVLVEGFSHQNFSDMVMAMDPRARFTYARAIYKGALKYLSARYACPYTVTPLGVKDLASEILDVDDEWANVRLSWSPVDDPLEPTAKPTSYILYSRVGGPEKDFDAGIMLSADSCAVRIRIPRGEIHSFRIAAANSGGRSFPSESIIAGVPADSLKAYVGIVNNFTRLAPPAYFAESQEAGFLNLEDGGVALNRERAYIGRMFDFSRTSKFINNELPGFGSSFFGGTGKVVYGNNFDFAIEHASGFFNVGYGVCSASVERFVADSTLFCDAFALDIICGKQLRTPRRLIGTDYDYEALPTSLQHRLLCCPEKAMIISGAHVAADASGHSFYSNIQPDSLAATVSSDFLEKHFGVKYLTFKGSDSKKTCLSQNSLLSLHDFSLLGDSYDGHYGLENSDAVRAMGKSKVLLRYSDSFLPAAVANGNKVFFAFPLECVADPATRSELIEQTIKLLE